jgi:hypothetical protein
MEQRPLYAVVDYEAKVGDSTFAVPFPYIEKAHVYVYVDDYPVNFTWLSDNSIRLQQPLLKDATVRVKRQTPLDRRLVDFQSASVLTEKDLDVSNLQVFFNQQEVEDDLYLGLLGADVSNLKGDKGDYPEQRFQWATEAPATPTPFDPQPFGWLPDIPEEPVSEDPEVTYHLWMTQCWKNGSTGQCMTTWSKPVRLTGNDAPRLDLREGWIRREMFEAELAAAIELDYTALNEATSLAQNARDEAELAASNAEAAKASADQAVATATEAADRADNLATQAQTYATQAQETADQAVADTASAVTDAVAAKDAAVAAKDEAIVQAGLAAEASGSAVIAYENAQGEAAAALVSKNTAVDASGEAVAAADAAVLAKTDAEGAASAALVAETNATQKATEAANSAVIAETNAQAAVTAATEADGSAQAALTASTDAKNFRDQAETHATAAVSAATDADGSAQAALAAQTAAENSATQTNTDAQAATIAKTDAEGAATAALTAKTDAENYATNASLSAQAAATAATEADGSAQAALTAKTEAENSAQAAATAATEADGSATAALTARTQAETSASDAADSADAARLDAQAAATAATEADGSATAALTAKTQAQSAASDAADSASAASLDAQAAASAATEADGSATAALTARTKAETAETNAAQSASDAADSASAASLDAQAAATAATEADGSAQAALTAKTQAEDAAGNAQSSAQSAVTAETNAQGHAQTALTASSDAQDAADAAVLAKTDAEGNATSALTARTQAQTSATNAATSESNAATSEANAAQSASDAADSANAARLDAQAAVQARTDAEGYASAALVAKTDAVDAAGNAEQSAVAAAQSKTDAEGSASASLVAQTKSEQARDAAQSAQSDAETARDEAVAAKNIAEQEATAAVNASTDAEGHANVALTAQSQASSSASNAATSESNAATSESNAANSEANAATSEANAANSASQAAQAENNAEQSATQAMQEANVAIQAAADASDKAELVTQVSYATGTGMRINTANAISTDYTGEVTPVASSNVSDSPDGVVFSQGGWWYTRPMMRVDPNKTYKVEARFKVLTDSTDPNKNRFYVGVVTLDENFNFISGGAGTHRYCTLSGSTYTAADGLVEVTGFIGGIGDAHDNFREGTKYIRLVFISNYSGGDGSCVLSDLSVMDFADLQAVEERVRATEDEAFYSLKVQSDGRVAGIGAIADPLGTALLFQADQIGFTHDAGVDIFPFTIRDGIVYIDKARMVTLEANSIVNIESVYNTEKRAQLGNTTIEGDFTLQQDEQILWKDLHSSFRDRLVMRSADAQLTGGSRTASGMPYTGLNLYAAQQGNPDNPVIKSGGKYTEVTIRASGGVRFGEGRTTRPTVPSISFAVKRQKVGSTTVETVGTGSFTGRVYTEDTIPLTYHSNLWEEETFTANLPTSGQDYEYWVTVTNKSGEWGTSGGSLTIEVKEEVGSDDSLVVNTEWSMIKSKPATATRWPTWNEVTGKPTSFTPSSHSHSWSEITGKPSSFTPSSHSHSWNEITGKPSKFTPSSHSHSYTEINFNGNFDINGTQAGGQSNGVYVTPVTNQGSTNNPTYTAVLSAQVSSSRSVHFSVDSEGYIWGMRSHSNSGTYTFQSKAKYASVAGSVSWGDISNKPSSFTPSSHNHSWSEITGKPSTFTPSSHTHTWNDISGGSVNEWGTLRISSSSGYVDIGAANTNYLHIYTDRPSFYFNAPIYEDRGGRVYSTKHKPTPSEVGLGNVSNVPQVQRGGGANQGTNDIHIGWSATQPRQLLLQVDSTDFGGEWPIDIQGRAASASSVHWDDVTSKPYLTEQNQVSASIGTSGWYTIAQGSARTHGKFTISDKQSGRHNLIVLQATGAYGKLALSVLQGVRFSTETIRHARIIYPSSDRTYGTYKLQLYLTNPSYSLNVVQHQDAALNSGWSNWSLINPTLENLPSGYSELSSARINHITSTSGHTSLQDLYVAGSQVLKFSDLQADTPPPELEGTVRASWLSAGVVQANLIASGGLNVSKGSGSSKRTFLLQPDSERPIHFYKGELGKTNQKDLFYVDGNGGGYFSGGLAPNSVDSQAIAEDAKKAIYPYYLADSESWIKDDYNTTVGSGSSVYSGSLSTLKADDTVSVRFRFADSLSEQYPDYQYSSSIYSVQIQRQIGSGGSWQNVGSAKTVTVTGWYQPSYVEDYLAPGEPGVMVPPRGGYYYSADITVTDTIPSTSSYIRYRAKVTRTTSGTGTSGGIKPKYTGVVKAAFKKNEFSKASTGYWIDKETGFCYQWGSTSIGSNSTEYDYFPKRFTQVFQVIANRDSSSSDNNYEGAYVRTFSTTSVLLENETPKTRNVRWLAVGFVQQ